MNIKKVTTFINLYDTLERKRRSVSYSKRKKHLNFYCCGPTVYNYAHLGNYRTFIIQDVFYRILKISNIGTNYIRNITDVDDKIIRCSLRLKCSLSSFSKKWTERFKEDCSLMNIIKPNKEPLATNHIEDQIKMIKCLISKKYAYTGQDKSIYYCINSFDKYGGLSKIRKDEISSKRGDCIKFEKYFRKEFDNLSDFALWKTHKSSDKSNYWYSPWGIGRPGWHIECSAIIRTIIGDSLDLHSGGVDLCFPHHENEIAQNEVITGKKLSNHWFHISHLMIEGQKMSKSLNNLLTVDSLRRKGKNPITMRYLLLSGHYSQNFNLTFNGLISSESAIKKINDIIIVIVEKIKINFFNIPISSKDIYCHQYGSHYFDSAWASIVNNLNIPLAIGRMFAVKVNSISMGLLVNAWIDLKRILYVLGLERNFQNLCNSILIPSAVICLLNDRLTFRSSNDFKYADKLRINSLRLGWISIDNKTYFNIRPNSVLFI